MKRSNKKVKIPENCKTECTFEEAVRYIACGLLPKKNRQIPIEDDNLSENEKIELDIFHNGGIDVFLQDQVNKEFSNRMSEVYSINKDPYYEDENFYLRNFEDIEDFEKNYTTDYQHKITYDVIHSDSQKSSLEESLKLIALYEKENDSQYHEDKQKFLQYIDNQEKYDSTINNILKQYRDNLLSVILENKIKTSGIKENINKRSNIESSEWHSTRNFNDEENNMSIYNDTIKYKDILIDFQDVFCCFKRKITSFDEKVVRERSKGGKNSYSKNRDLEPFVYSLVDKYCNETYKSKESFYDKICDILEEKYINLLKEYSAYKEYEKNKDYDWQRTIKDWCRKYVKQKNINLNISRKSKQYIKH